MQGGNLPGTIIPNHSGTGGGLTGLPVSAVAVASGGYSPSSAMGMNMGGVGMGMPMNLNMNMPMNSNMSMMNIPMNMSMTTMGNFGGNGAYGSSPTVYQGPPPSAPLTKQQHHQQQQQHNNSNPSTPRRNSSSTLISALSNSSSQSNSSSNYDTGSYIYNAGKDVVPSRDQKERERERDIQKLEEKSKRKIMDLEIANESLLAVNSTLESTIREQASQIQIMKRHLLMAQKQLQIFSLGLRSDVGDLGLTGLEAAVGGADGGEVMGIDNSWKSWREDDLVLEDLENMEGDSSGKSSPSMNFGAGSDVVEGAGTEGDEEGQSLMSNLELEIQFSRISAMLKQMITDGSRAVGKPTNASANGNAVSSRETMLRASMLPHAVPQQQEQMSKPNADSVSALPVRVASASATATNASASANTIDSTFSKTQLSSSTSSAMTLQPIPSTTTTTADITTSSASTSSSSTTSSTDLFSQSTMDTLLKKAHLVIESRKAYVAAIEKQQRQEKLEIDGIDDDGEEGEDADKGIDEEERCVSGSRDERDGSSVGIRKPQKPQQKEQQQSGVKKMTKSLIHDADSDRLLTLPDVKIPATLYGALLELVDNVHSDLMGNPTLQDTKEPGILGAAAWDMLADVESSGGSSGKVIANRKSAQVLSGAVVNFVKTTSTTSFSVVVGNPPTTVSKPLQSASLSNSSTSAISTSTSRPSSSLSQRSSGSTATPPPSLRKPSPTSSLSSNAKKESSTTTSATTTTASASGSGSSSGASGTGIVGFVGRRKR
jgi:hypothetical protein